MPAVLLAGAFVLPLLARAVDWLGLPREFHLALPLILGVAALALLEQFRRTAALNADKHGAFECDQLAGSGSESHNASE